MKFWNMDEQDGGVSGYLFGVRVCKFRSFTLQKIADLRVRMEELQSKLHAGIDELDAGLRSLDGKLDLIAPQGGAAGGIMWPESKIAHKYLDGLRGVEIGAASYQPFGLKTLNVNWTDDFAKHPSDEKNFGNEPARVDIVADGDNLPFKDGTLDFVLHSHLLEHFFDPIKAIGEGGV